MNKPLSQAKETINSVSLRNSRLVERGQDEDNQLHLASHRKKLVNKQSADTFNKKHQKIGLHSTANLPKAKIDKSKALVLKESNTERSETFKQFKSNSEFSIRSDIAYFLSRSNDDEVDVSQKDGKGFNLEENQQKKIVIVQEQGH